MERRFFMSDFEQSLKENADKFQMVPSKKVWHGIYNDLHPGKRWPSVTMSLLLIFTLVVIGHLNTNNSRQLAYVTNKNSETKNVAAEEKRTGSLKIRQRIVVRKTDLDKARKAFVYATGEANNTGLTTQPVVNNYQNTILNEDRLLADNLKPGNLSGSFFFKNNFTFTPQVSSVAGEDKMTETVYNKETHPQNNFDINEVTSGTLQEKIDASKSTATFNNQLTDKSLRGGNNNATNGKLSGNKNINNIVSAKKNPNAESKVAKLHKKRNANITWVYFAAPVVSTVSFNGKSLKPDPPANFSPGLSVNQKENKVLHNSALGLEAGGQMNYALTKKLRFTSGVHLTYSGYNVISNEVHPTFATLLLRNPNTGVTYSRSFKTHYGDGTGQSVVIMRNYNWQVSMPVGLQYEISGSKKVQFNVGADLEPSLVLKSNAYVLASDGNNYVNDPALLRKWNINSNFGAFVTFRSSKFKWQVGPNIRYQWLSTYQKEYTVKEHLIDYGIRIGISR
jgi:hypothetical protein